MEIDRGDKDEHINRNKGETRESSGSWWGAWGQQWIDSVKEKSAETFQMVKKDLNEFVDVIQGDTAEKLSETALKLNTEEDEKATNDESTRKMMKQGLSKLLNSVSDFISTDPDDRTEEVITIVDDRTSSSQKYSRKQEKLRQIQTDPGTYCNEPDGPFEDWLHTFDLEDEKYVMSDLLIQNTSVRAIYTQLVPNVISHTTFWQRYFFSLYLLDSEEKKRNEILARAHTASNDDDSNGGWDDDDEDDMEILLQNPYKVEQSLPENISHLTIEEVINHSQKQGNSNQLNTSSDKLINNGKIHNEKSIVHNDSEKVQNVPKKDKNSPKAIDDDKIESSKLLFNPDQQSLNEKYSNRSSNSISSNEGCVFPSRKEQNNELQNKLINTLGEESVVKKEQISPSVKTAAKNDHHETSSVSSWLSIDDEIKVKKITDTQMIQQHSNENSDGKTSNSSSGVLVNKSDADDLDEFDLDLEEDDDNDEELQKIVQEIKQSAISGELQDIDDDDWENWE